MREQSRFDRGWRGAMTVGIVVSVLVHAALLAMVRFSVEPMSGGATTRALQVIPLPEDQRPDVDKPMEVIELADASAGGSPPTSGPSPAQRLTLPEIAPIPTAVSSRCATPRNVPRDISRKRKRKRMPRRRMRGCRTFSSAQPPNRVPSVRSTIGPWTCSPESAPAAAPEWVWAWEAGTAHREVVFRASVGARPSAIAYRQDSGLPAADPPFGPADDESGPIGVDPSTASLSRAVRSITSAHTSSCNGLMRSAPETVSS